MNKLLISGLAVVALALTGCTTTEAAPSVFQNVEPESQVVVPEPESNDSSSISNADDMFVIMMEAVDTPSYFLEGDLLYTLQEQAVTTCGYIDQGMTSEQVTNILIEVILGSDADQEVKDAFMAATIASVYSYCPEYQGFWE
jgi:hypothetical protein